MPSDLHRKDKALFTLRDLKEWKPPAVTRIIQGGILNLQGKMVIFGGEGTWKSMVAQHLAHHLARGTDWLGFHTSLCNVIKVQVELPQYEDRERMLKYIEGSRRVYLARHLPLQPTSDQLAYHNKQAEEYASPTNMVYRTSQFLHIDESSGFESLKKNIILTQTEMPDLPLVLILDPLYKMFNRDLSSGEDISALINKFDVAMEELNFTTVIVAHSRKTQMDEEGNPQNLGSQDISGSRHLANWVDTIIRIDAGKGDETNTRFDFTFTKHRTAHIVIPRITVKWDTHTLHPIIINRKLPVDYKVDEGEIRDDYDFSHLD